MKVSVVIPVYNEADTIEGLVARVLDVDVGAEKEVVIVNDCSTDGTRERLETIEARYEAVRVFHHDVNRGKGAALRTGFGEVRGDIIIVQDADLEYDPKDYGALLAPILDGRADVVYGSRFTGTPRRVLFFWHSVGNKLLTLLSNMVTDLNLTDMETCYKVFRREVLDGMRLRSNRFGFEPEFTAKVAKRKFRIYEVPISYSGRTYAEGKKVTWKDGVIAIYFIIRYRIFD